MSGIRPVIQRPRGGGRTAGPGFPLPFGGRHSLLGHPFPPGIPPLLRSAYRHQVPDHDGVSMFRTHEIRPGPGALCTPGTTAPTRPGTIPSRRLPPSSGRSLSPRHHDPPRDVQLTRHQQEFTGVHPTPGLPLTCDPRTDQGPLGFPVSSAPASPGDRHARHGGDRSYGADPDYVLGMKPNLQSTYSLAACDLMSQLWFSLWCCGYGLHGQRSRAAGAGPIQLAGHALRIV